MLLLSLLFLVQEPPTEEDEKAEKEMEQQRKTPRHSTFYHAKVSKVHQLTSEALPLLPLSLRFISSRGSVPICV